jgi:hypothetical protein
MRTIRYRVSLAAPLFEVSLVIVLKADAEASPAHPRFLLFLSLTACMNTWGDLIRCSLIAYPELVDHNFLESYGYGQT